MAGMQQMQGAILLRRPGTAGMQQMQEQFTAANSVNNNCGRN
jgi:hypothetical protein